MIDVNELPSEFQKATASRLLSRLAANSTFLGSMPRKVRACKSYEEMSALIKKLQREVYDLDVLPGQETVCSEWHRG